MKRKPVASLSIFLVTTFIEGIIGKSYKANKQTTRELFVKVSTQQQATILLSQTRSADLHITVTPHRSLNSSQGVTSDPELMNKIETDLLEGLKSQGVAAVRQITIRREDKEIPTKHLILTFDQSTLPEFINLGYIRC